MAHNLSNTITVLDDIANQDIEMQPAVADTIYLVVDTNVLLDHIHILKDLVEDIAFTRVPLVVICPGIVLNELDRQKTSDRLGQRARKATDWMLREVTRKDLPQPIVKGQAQRETCKSTKNWKTKDETKALSDNDDLIVDCCQYFERKAATVLYTRDKNLCLRCNQEGLRFINPPLPYEYTHLDLVERMLGVLPEYDYYLTKLMQNHDHVIRDNRKEDDGMMIDDDRPNCIQIPQATIVHQQVIERSPPLLRALPEYTYHFNKMKRNQGHVIRENKKADDGMIIDDGRLILNQLNQIPQATIVHQQVIERFMPLLRALVKRVGGAETGDLRKKGSEHAPKSSVEEYTARDCLEYLQDKKHIVFAKPDPPLHRFLREPYSGQGAQSGVEWAASAWRAAVASLRQIGETWEDDAMLEQVKLLDQYVTSEYQYF